MRQPRLDERNAEVARLYGAGRTLEDTGAHFDISAQRVHQILLAYFPKVMRGPDPTGGHKR